MIIHMPYFNVETDISIYYEVHGNGSPLVILHGNGNSAQDLIELNYVGRLENDY